VRVRWLGRLPYEEAWDLQRALHEGRVAGRSDDDYLLLLEHPPVYTIGRFSDGSNMLITPEMAAAVGAEIHHIDRGGDVTYHGPGQLVGYPILHLGGRPDVTGHVRRIERTLIAVLADLGMTAWREDAYPGVWTDRGKIAAIGVKVDVRGVTRHGFALNVDPDMSYWGGIIACGLEGAAVTSLESLVSGSIPILALS